MKAQRFPLVAALVAVGCADRTLTGGDDEGAEAHDDVDDPDGAEDDPAADSNAASLSDPTEEPVFDPYPDCRPLLPYDMQYEPTTCGAAIGVVHVEADDPDVCDACMCWRGCRSAADCPAPPSRPTAEMHCTTHVEYGACIIACATEEDCPPEMICRQRAAYLPDAPSKVCAFAAVRPQCESV